MRKSLLTLLISLITYLCFAQPFTVFQPGSKGSYGFDKWPFTESKYLTGFLEHVPKGLEGKTTCIIDGHGVGFKSHDPTNLNEGLAKYIRKLNGDLINPLTGKKYIALMPAGGEWIQHEEWANMIAYAMHHPQVNKIVITGLSGGAMRVLSFLMDTKYAGYVEVITGAVSFSGKARITDIDQLSEVPLLAYHGLNDRQIKPGNIVSIRKKNDNMILNLFNAGHNTWDAGWNDGFKNKPVQSFRGWDSDPYMSVWEFLKMIDEKDEEIDVVRPVECDVEVYISDKFKGCMVYDRPYKLNDSTTLILSPKE